MHTVCPISQTSKLSPPPPTAPPTDDPLLATEAQTEEDHTDPVMKIRKRRSADGFAPLPVAAVIVYRSLGQLLPERYDPDRRSLR